MKIFSSAIQVNKIRHILGVIKVENGKAIGTNLQTTLINNSSFREVD